MVRQGNRNEFCSLSHHFHCWPKSLRHTTMIEEKATLRDNNNNNNNNNDNNNTNLARQGLNDRRAVAVAHHVVGCAATVDEPWWTR